MQLSFKGMARVRIAPIDIQLFEDAVPFVLNIAHHEAQWPRATQEGFYHRLFSFIRIFINNFVNCRLGN